MENTIKKAMAIRKSKELSALLGNRDDATLGHTRSRYITRHAHSSNESGSGGTALHSPVYHLLPVDLRLGPEALAPLLTESSTLGSPVLFNNLPTLLLFECVLAYVQPEASNALIRWFVDYFSPVPNAVLGGLVYEMFGLEDAFGKVMLNNLRVSSQRRYAIYSHSPFPQG